MRLHESPRRHRTRVVLAALVAVVGFVMTQQPAVALQQAQAAMPQAQGGPVDGGIIDRVLVRVDGRAILHSEFEAQWRDQLAAIAAQFSQEQIDAQAPLLRMNMMAGLAQSIMLELRAEDLGLVADVNDVDRLIQNMRETNGLTDDAAWAQALATNGITEDFLREQAEGSIIQQRLMAQEISRKVFVSPVEVQNYYDQNMEQFTEPEQVLFQQLIFVYTNDRAADRTRADNAVTELRAGISLSAVGNKYATPNVDLVQDASQATWIAPEDLQPEILATVNNLSPLEYSEPVAGTYGFHILQLMDRREGSVMPFEEVSASIANFIRNQKMATETDKYSAELMKSASIEIYAEEFIDLPQVWAEGNQGAPAGSPGRGR